MGNNLLVFVVYDSKAEYYKNPFIMRSKGEAVRGFMDIANDKSSEIGKHPEDFSLYLIAEFDDSKGNYIPITPQIIGKAIEYVVEKEI